MRTRVTFDGVDLGELCHVSDLQAPLLPRTICEEDVAGRDGSLYTGVRLQPRDINVRMTVKGATLADRREAARNVAAVLAVDSPRPLSISADDGLWWMAIPTTDGDVELMANHSSFDVTFRAVDPVAYGDQRTITVPSGGSVTFLVDGTYPARPTVRASAAANGAGGFWKLQLEDGSYLIATVPDGLGTAPVVADCLARTLYVNGTLTLLQPDADWLELAPGAHTLTMAGTGAATVTFDERWL